MIASAVAAGLLASKALLVTAQNSTTGSGSRNDSAACAALMQSASQMLPNLTINTVEYVPAGTNYNDTQHGGFDPTVAYNISEHCRFSANISTSNMSSVRFEVWLPPASAWNENFLMVGNGGDNGMSIFTRINAVLYLKRYSSSDGFFAQATSSMMQWSCLLASTVSQRQAQTRDTTVTAEMALSLSSMEHPDNMISDIEPYVPGFRLAAQSITVRETSDLSADVHPKTRSGSPYNCLLQDAGRHVLWQECNLQLLAWLQQWRQTRAQGDPDVPRGL